MKHLSLIILTLFLYSCEDSKDSSTRSSSSIISCTVNGVPVDCQSGAGSTAGLTAKLAVRVSSEGRTIEALENVEDLQEENGKRCEVRVHAGQVFKLSQDENTIETTLDEKKRVFFKQNNPKETKWIHFNKDLDTGTIYLSTVVRKPNQLILSLDCIYDGNL
ncbi:MAG TPA: hypothetical protein VNJ01_08810 [Bacteriovoracaceae bacterium]|nr:hypothetical protein [Bacteriovoracaceae bacterium]